MLIVHPHFHRRRTGVTAHTEAVVRELRRQGLDARVFGGHVDPALPRVGVFALGRRAFSTPVVWHAHRNLELLLGLVLRFLLARIRVVATRHGSTPPSWWSRWLLRRADAVVTLSEEAREQLPMPSTVVSHGVDLERFSPPDAHPQAFAALQLPGQRAVGVVGRVRPDKGQGDFVAALQPLLADFPQWTPVLVGLAKPADVAWAKGLQAQSHERLVLAGEQQDVARWYRGLEVMVQPSHRESFSLVVLEAMASGCCVIASRLPHLHRLVDHERTGLLFEPGDVAGLRALLQRVLGDEALRRRLGDAAAQEARARFGVAHEARALRALYGEAGAGAG